MLEARGLTRVFGRRRAVDEAQFTLSAGECLALFGPNGAGKTTLLRLCAGLLKPTAGEVRVDGVRLRGDAAARAQVGLISHQSLLYGALTARANVEFAARLYGVADAPAAAERALDDMRVLDRAEAPVRALSRGLQQRVSIARATVHRPRVLLLDEPYTGLDAAGAGALTALLRRQRTDGATLVLVTHNLAEGLALATQAVVMSAGRFVRHDVAGVLDERQYTAEYRAMWGMGDGE